MKVKVRVTQKLYKDVIVEVDNFEDAWWTAREECEPFLKDADSYDDFDYYCEVIKE